MQNEKTPKQKATELVEEIKIAINTVLLIADKAKIRLTYESDLDVCQLISNYFEEHINEPTDKAPYYNVSKTYGNVTVKVKTPQHEKQLQFQHIQ